MVEVKVALVHDWLTGQRGGEKVLEVLAEIFPQAPIYTLFHFRGSQSRIIEERVIETSFLRKFPFLKSKYRLYLPLFPLAAELFDLSPYELIVSTSHCVAKGIIPHPDSLHISYIHSPIRYAWNQYFPYFSPSRLGFFSRLAIPPIIHRLRVWDESSSARVDYFVANSENVKRRIRKYYRRDADVIFPPVDTDFYIHPDAGTKGELNLIVSALVPYKRIDLAVETFNRRKEVLKIVGSGPEERRLKKMARPNVEFLGSVGSETLLSLYQKARAMILPAEEDFGIAALEAQACGTPVIAYGRGGARETVIDGQTGVLFSELTETGLTDSLDKIQGLSFNKTILRSNAMRFSRQIFKEKMAAYLGQKWTEFKGNQ